MLFKMTTGFLGLATAATGIYLVASMIGAYSSAKVQDLKMWPLYFLSHTTCIDWERREEPVRSCSDEMD